MNKSYRSIWNEALGAWVAVSEIENAKGKPVGSSVKAVDGIAARTKLVLRVIPLMLGVVFGLNNYAYASSGATVTTTTTDAGAAETTQAPIIIGTKSIAANVTAGTATLTGTSQSANLYYNENPGNPYRDGLTSGTTLVLDNTSAGGVVIGNGASARNFGGLAIGGYASANQNYGMAFGAYSLVSAYGGIAIGAGSLAAGRNSIAMQRQAAATGDQSLALGTVSYAKGHGAVAIGQSATAEGNMAVAIGSADLVSWPGNDIYRDEDAPSNTKPGTLTRANGLKSVAVGSGSKSTGAQSTAVGQSTQATADATFAAGSASLASGGASLAIGDRAKAVSSQGIAIGQLAEASNSWNISIGRFAGVNPVVLATEGRNVAIGDGALRYGSNANNNIGLGTDAGAGLNGADNVILGTYANAAQAIDSAVRAGTTETEIGVQPVTATLPGSTNTTTVKAVSANHSVAIGPRAIAISSGSVALGQMAKGLGATTVAVGNGSRSLGNNAVAMGNTANAGAAGAIAIGQQANYEATAPAGYKTTGVNSISIGTRSNSAAQNAIVLGTDAAVTAATSVGGKINDRAGNAYDSSLVGTTSGVGSIAIGAFSQVKGVNAAAIGQASEAVGQNSFAGGNDSHAIGKSSTALGDGAKALNNSAQAFGYAATASGTSSIAMGNAASASGTGGLAAGNNAVASGNQSLAIGVGSQATAEKSISIGTGNIVSGANSGALGDPSYITGIGTYAIGNDNGSADNPIAADNAGVFGNLNRMTADADNSRAIGNYNHITTDSTYVLGSGINSDPAGNTLGNTVANSVYLGNDSQVAGGAAATAGTLFNTDIANVTGSTTSAGATGTVSSAIINGVTYGNFAGQTAVGAVTVGAAGSERRIQNVAAGEISTTSTDAINGSQLYATHVVVNNIATSVASALGGTAAVGADGRLSAPVYNLNGSTYSNVGDALTALANSGVKYYSVNTTDTAAGSNADNKGATGLEALAAGVRASADGAGSVAVGKNAVSSGTSSVSVGTSSSGTGASTVAVGNSSVASHQNAVAIGNAARAAGSGNIAIGESAGKAHSTTGQGANAVFIGVQAGAESANNEAQVSVGWEAGKGTLGAFNVASGYQAGQFVNGTNNVAIGKQAGKGTAATSRLVVNNTVAIGTSAKASADNSVVIGNETIASAKDSVAIGQSADATADSAVAVGKNAQGAGSFAVSIGLDSKATKDGAVAMGSGSAAENTYTVALGNDAKASEDGATAVGRLAKAEAAKGLALGTESQVTVNKGVALGANSIANVAAGQVGVDPLDAVTGKDNSTWTATAGAVSVGNGTAETRQITSVAAGTQDTDAVNVAQLKAAGFALAASASSDGQLVDNTADAADKKVKNGQTVTVDAGKNIKLTQNGKTISVATKDEVSFNKATVGNIVADGATNKISGLENGSVASGSKEAVNGGQLYAQGEGVKNIIGGATRYDPDSGTFTNTDIGGTGKGNLNDAIAAVKATADAGWNLTAQGANGSKVGAGETVDLRNTDGNIQVAKAADADTVTFELADAIKVESVTAGDTVLNRDGVKVGNDVALASDGLKAGGLTVGTNGKISGLENGSVASGSKEAVNGGQLYAQGKGVETIIGGATQYDPATGTYTNADIGGTGKGNLNDAIAAVKATADKGWNLTAQGANSSNVGAGESVDLNNSDGNIVISKTASDDNVTFDLADAITVDSVTAGTGANRVVLDDAGVSVGGNTYISGNGINANNQKVTNVASGSVAAGSTDAVNGGQLYNTAASVANALGGGSTVNADGTVSAPAYTIIDPATGNSSVANNVGDAVTKLNGAVNSPLTFAGDSGSNVARKLGTTVNLKGGAAGSLTDGNIAVVADGSDTLNIKLAKELSGLGSIQTTDDAGNSTTVNGNGITVTPADAGKNPVSLTSDGINAGGNKVANVADGEQDGDAVNMAQLKKAAASSANKVEAGENIEVTEKQNADGSTTYTVATAKNVNFDSVTAGDTVLDGNGVKVGNDVALTSDGLTAGGLTVGTNGKISGLENGSVASGSKEAVNGGQLYGTADSVANALGGGSVVNADGTVSAPAYTIIDPATGNSTVANNVGDALTQLNSAVNSPLTFAGDSGSNVARKLGTTVNLKGGAAGSLTDNNIAVVADGTDTLSIKLAETVNLGSNGSVTTGQTVLNNDGVKVGDKVALTSDGLKAGDVNITSAGIDAGGKQISGVKAGEQDRDAANVAQLKAAAAASANKVAAGDNIEVSEKQNDDGSTTYTVATAKEVSFNSVTAGTGANRVVLDDAGVSVGGNTYISGNGINANNQKVTNVASGNVAAGSTDAVNGGQLHNTAASVANVFGGNATVNPDGSVSMSNIGGTGANNVNDAIAAVNQAAVEAKTTVSAGDNIVVAQSTNADGSTNYTVSTAKDLAVDSVKAGDTVLNGNGLSIANGPSITAGGLDMGGKKITNVADGEISATSKDAINGSQLYQAYQVLGGNANAINTITAPATENADGTTTPAGTVVTVVTNPDGTKTTTTETNQTVAVSTDKGGNQYTLTTYNVEGQNTYVTNDVIQAVGKMNEQGIKFFHTNDGVVKPVAQGHNTEDSSASGAYATAIGYQSVASGEGAVAMGNTYNTTDADGNAVARRTTAEGKNAVAIGTGSQALAENTIAIGTGNVVSGKNSGAIGDPNTVSGAASYALGNDNTVSTDNTFVVGNNVTQTMANSVILGNRSSATAVHTTAGGGNYTFAGANDANVAGVEDAVGVVSVGTEGETRQIQNVAAGVVSATSTDAINGSQLHYTNEAINSVANYTVNMGNQLNQRIDDVENRSNAGTATAMAVAGLPQAYLPGKSMVAVAGGTYRGESGYAVGYSSISDNGNWVIKGSATGNSRGHYGATAGVGYQW